MLIEPKQQGVSSSQFIERLSARLGPASVQVWQPQADHRPEAMQRWQTADEGRAQITTKSIAASARIYSAGGLKDSQNDIKTDALFPTWLLHQPLKLASKAGAPLHQGALVKLAGPQRLEATGWLLAEGADIAPALRDYFIYRSSQGVLLWIYSERLALVTQDAAQREWYLQGVFA